MNLQSLAICPWLEGLAPMLAIFGLDGPIVCTAPPWAIFLGGLAGSFVMMTGLWILFHARQSPRQQANPSPGLPMTAIGLLTLLAGFTLGAAAGAPESRPKRPSEGQHVILVVDASESVTRDLAGWRAALAEMQAALAPLARAPDTVGSLLLFGANQREIARESRLDKLLQQLPGLRPLDEQDANATAPRRALQRALEIAQASQRTARIVVLSDGLWTEAAPLPEIQLAAARGVRIDVLPVDAGPARLGIVASHMPRTVESGAEVPTRFVVAGERPETAAISFSRNRDKPRTQDEALGGAARQIRVDQSFDGRGLQFVELSLRRADGSEQMARLYTTVVAPPRLLVLGAAPWVSRLDPKRFEIARQADPRVAIDTSQAEVVIVDNLMASELHPETPARIAAAVQHGGLGLFFVNGPMRGSPTDETSIGSFKKTPLAQVLPVSPDRGLLIVEPPPRTIAIVIDSSGSMAGNRIALAKEMALRIVADMRPQDSIVIDTFPAHPNSIRTPLRLSPKIRRRVEGFIEGLQAGGGSDERTGIALIQSLPTGNCAAFLFSDGDVESQEEFAPGCSFNYVETQNGNNNFVSRSAHLVRSARKNGDAISISDAASGVPAFKFRFLHPPPDPIDFRKERFVPHSRIVDPTVAPRVPVNGVAITFPFADTNMVLFRDALPSDPVLAFRRLSGGAAGSETGAFLGALEGEWEGPQPIEALARHLERLSGWQERDKIQIELRETAGRVRMRIVASGDKATRRSLISLSATIQLDSGQTIAVDRETAGAGSDPWAFEGTFELPVADAAGQVVKGRLHLVHDSRTDRIPLVLPVVSRAETSLGREAYTTGRNSAALQALADPLGRVLKRGETLRLAEVAPAPPPRPLHAYLLSIGALACLFGFLAKRARP